MSEQTELQHRYSLEARIETLLFVAPGPVTVSQLAAALELDAGDIEQGLNSLESSYPGKRGLRIQRHAGRIQLTSSPDLAGEIERFLGLEATSRLSRAALESLAIVAYQQPVTRPQIDDIRGVNSDGVLKSLLNKGLIQDIGRADGPGRPIIYGTTTEFLQHFGLSSLDELPPLNLDQAIKPAVMTSPAVLKD